MRITNKQARELGLVLPGSGKKKKQMDGKTGSDAMMDAMCISHGLPVPVKQFKFHPDRRWAFDFLFAGLVAVEQVGGVWVKGHHSRGQSQIDDMERRNEAQIMGYIVLEFTPQQLEDGSAFPVIKRALESESEQS